MPYNKYTLKEISNVIAKSFIGESSVVISNLSIDSRHSSNNNETLFFAIKTKNNDGHNFIPDLISSGVTCFVVEQIPDNIPDYAKSKASFIIVDNSIFALQLLAKWKRDKSDLKTIAITGSNGKTIVKEWLSQLLSKDFSIAKSPKSYNSQIGVALSLWGINSSNNLGIFEAGISEVNEMSSLEEMINPEIGIFTNIGSAHSDNFTSQENKIKEKLKLFVNTNKLFYKDDELLTKIIVSSKSLKNTKKISWSNTNKADLQILGVLKQTKSSTITGLYKGEVIKIDIPFTDNASIENAIVSWLIMLDFGYENAEIFKRMQNLPQVEMRLEVLEGVNNSTIINDGYSLDLDSLNVALDFLDTQFQHKNRTLIISSLEQSDEVGESLYLKVSETIDRHKVNKLVLVGEDICRYKNLFRSEKIITYNNTAELNSEIDSLGVSNEIILVKGARSFKFETTVGFLASKSHDTVLEVNLSAVVNNLNYFRTLIRPSTKLMVMVKAFSYGGGSYEIANILQYHKVDYLAVAYADEGKALRKAGIETPILVLNPEVSSYSTLIEYNLEPEIYSLRVLNEFLKVVGGKVYPIHLKIDTGMHRLGFQEREIDELISSINLHDNLKIMSIFSHLSSADDLLEEEFTIKQADSLQRVSAKIIKNIRFNKNELPLIHLLNTSGIINYPQYQFNMVRLGIGLHGITKENNNKLSVVARLKTLISQIKKIKKGESVGYNRKFKADHNMKVATLPIGYADGIDRRWGNEIGSVVINGKRANIIGTIAMDMLMVDVTYVDCKEGDVVEVFGDEISIVEIADKIETIPYEILTKVSSRVKRLYYQE